MITYYISESRERNRLLINDCYFLITGRSGFMTGGARTDLRSPIPDPEDQKILELRQMGLLPQVDTNIYNPNTNIKDNQEETTMATEMTKEEMERKLAEIKSAANEKASSIPKPVKYAAAAGAGVGLGYAAHKILHKGGDKAAEQVANLVSKLF